MKQRRKYKLGLGGIVSLALALLASVPRLLKAEQADPQAILMSITYTTILSMLCWLIHQIAIQHRSSSLWSTLPWIRYAVGILTGVLLSLVYHELAVFVFDASPILQGNVLHERIPLTLIYRGALLSGLTFFVAYYLHLSSLTQQSQVENERLKRENLQARLNSLKQQISPHFLFNTLNTLSVLTKEEKVKQYIIALANVYRYPLQHQERDIVKVAEELGFIESYLYILRERFEAGLDVAIRIHAGVLETSIPPLALQTLVENAVKHNIVSASRPLQITITDQNNFIVVRNNLQKKQSLDQESSQSGLNNINERYKLLAGKEIIIEQTDHEFIVKLPVI